MVAAFESTYSLPSRGEAAECCFADAQPDDGVASRDADLWKARPDHPLRVAFPWVFSQYTGEADADGWDCCTASASASALLLMGCDLAKDVETDKTFSAASVLNTVLSAERASDLSIFYRDLGLLQAEYRSIADWGEALRAARRTLSEADGQLQLLELDTSSVLEAEPFDADAEQVDQGEDAWGPQALRWLLHLSWASLWQREAGLPLLPLAKAKMILGSTERRDTRADEHSTVSRASALLRAASARALGCDAEKVADPALARSCADLLKHAELPAVWQGQGFGPDAALEDFIDAAAFQMASLRGAVETKRLLNCKDLLPNLGAILQRFSTSVEALSSLLPAMQRLLPRAVIEGPLYVAAPRARRRCCF